MLLCDIILSILWYAGKLRSVSCIMWTNMTLWLWFCFFFFLLCKCIKKMKKRRKIKKWNLLLLCMCKIWPYRLYDVNPPWWMKPTSFIKYISARAFYLKIPICSYIYFQKVSLSLVFATQILFFDYEISMPQKVRWRQSS